jgi:hypothetical protein
MDTCSLIELRQKNPMDIYETVWARLGSLVDNGFLISPIEVKREVHAVDEDIRKWLLRNDKMFVPLDEAQMKKMFEIQAQFPALADPEKETPVADPFVISLALTKDPRPTFDTFGTERVVVSEEKLKGNRIRIPFVCQYYGVKWMSVFDMFRTEGWKF